MADADDACISIQQRRVFVQIMQGGIVQPIPLCLGPAGEMAFIAGPPRRGVFLGIAIGIGPFHIGIAHHVPDRLGGFGQGPRGALRQPAEPAGPGALSRQGWGKLTAIRAGDTFIRARPAPAIIGNPGSGGAQKQDRRAGRGCGAADEDQVMLLHRFRPSPSGQRDQIAARCPIRRDVETVGHRPTASVDRAILGRFVIHARQTMRGEDRHLRWPISCDLQIPAVRRGADPQSDRVARGIAEPVRIGPYLQHFGVAGRADIVIVQNMPRPSPAARCRV